MKPPEGREIYADPAGGFRVELHLFPPLHFPPRCLCTDNRASVLKSDVSAHPQARCATLSVTSWKRTQDGGASKITENTGAAGSHQHVGAAQVTVSHRRFVCICKTTWQDLIWRFNGSKSSSKKIALCVEADYQNWRDESLWTQSDQSNYTICTSRQNTHAHNHVCGGQSEDTRALASKRGRTSATTSSRWSFHAKMCEENPEIKK